MIDRPIGSTHPGYNTPTPLTMGIPKAIWVEMAHIKMCIYLVWMNPFVRECTAVVIAVIVGKNDVAAPEGICFLNKTF